MDGDKDKPNHWRWLDYYRCPPDKFRRHMINKPTEKRTARRYRRHTYTNNKKSIDLEMDS